jgi:putative membrane protein
MKKLLARFVINAVALWLAAYFIPGIKLTGGLAGLAVVAVVFGLVNALIKPVVKFFAFPFILLTLGLFTVVINASLLWLTAGLTEALAITQFTAPFLGALLISVVSFVLSMFVSDDDKK